MLYFRQIILEGCRVDYENLFSKGKIGKLEMKNRIVMPPMGTGLASSTGEVTNELVRYYEERAKGGCGLIITEIARVDDVEGVGLANQISVTNVNKITGLEKLARAVHKYDSKIFIQLHHPGRQGHSMLMGGRQIVAPSPVMCKTVGEMPRELTTEEVEVLVRKFITGAKIGQTAGMDGVELHGAHGYLIGQFLSPLTNLRTDKYGGNFTNRMRFITEIILGIKHICGKDFPISVRMDGDEFVEGGLTLSEAVEAARYLESIGIDSINISSGTYESGVTIIEPISYDQGWKRHLAQAIKDSVNIPVIGCMVIRKPEFAESLIKERTVDFVALGRAQIADPEWGKKAMEGREKEIRQCISCLHCIEQLSLGTTTKCAVNPRMGRELEFQNFEKNGEGRVVAVIGGGPAGMEASRVLALKGFKPILFEAKDVLGGSVYLGSKPPLKEKLNWFLDNLEYEIRQLDVDIRLNTKPTIEDIKALNPYAVYVASGSLPIIPPIPGIKGENVCTVVDVLEERVCIKDKNIVVIGSGMTGLETSEFLAEMGNKVTIIEMMNKIGTGIYRSNLYDVTSRLEKYGVEMLPSMKLVSIDKNGITAENMISGNLIYKEADQVVLSLGVRPNNEIVEELEKNFSVVKVLGDSNKPGRIADAIQTGFEKAYILE